MMRALIILTLAICISLVCYKSIQPAKAVSLDEIHSTRQVRHEGTPCLANLSTKLSICEQSNKDQQQMVLIRGQVLLVEER